MSTDLAASPDESVRAIDSLVANEFAVMLDDQPVSGIFTVADLNTFKLDVRTTTAIKKMQEPFTITKMVQRDPHSPFNKWIRDTFAAADDIDRPRRTLIIAAVDDGTVIRRWTIQGAWISRISYSDFDSSSSQMVEESVTIHFDEIEDDWPLLDEA